MAMKKSAAAGRAPRKLSSKKPAPRRASASRGIVMLVGTRKGAFVMRSDTSRRIWKLEGPHHFGCVVTHVVADPREPKVWLAAVKTGHLGPTVFRTSDAGKTWKEAKNPPAFPKAPEGEQGRAVDTVFWLTPGGADEPGVWWAGTNPHGLFRSEDGGETWTEVTALSAYLASLDHSKEAFMPTPGGAITHSILVDPRDSAHLYVSMSVGGTFESRDRGATWKPMNKGVAIDYMPGQEFEYGQDPHCVVASPVNPDRLYQQNHCGIYRIDRPSNEWIRIGKNMPKAIGDIGFVIVTHPRDADRVWVIPMDGTTVWPRTSIGGKPAVFGSDNAGRSWKRLDRGLPRANAWHTVYRQGFACDTAKPLGLYFGTSSGQLWASRDEGGSWTKICEDLPAILSVEIAAP